MRRTATTAALSLLLLASTGCQTSIGNYFANRARDFGDMFLVQGGIGYGLGAQVKAAGVAHVGLGAISFHRDKTLGLVYGSFRPKFDRRSGRSRSEDDLILFFPHLSNRPPEGGESHFCLGLFPAIASWHNTSRSAIGSSDKWLWSEGTPKFRKAQVHAFDLEVSATALFLSFRVGFSPGEFFDFLLGWFGVDIASDDEELILPEEEGDLPPPELRWKGDEDTPKPEDDAEVDDGGQRPPRGPFGETPGKGDPDDE